MGWFSARIGRIVLLALGAIALLAVGLLAAGCGGEEGQKAAQERQKAAKEGQEASKEGQKAALVGRGSIASGFEIDSDANNEGRLSEHCRPDWNEVGEVRQNDVTTGPDRRFVRGRGVKEDTTVPLWVTGSIPNNKSDLFKTFGAYVQPEENGPGFLNLYWDTRAGTLWHHAYGLRAQPVLDEMRQRGQLWSARSATS